MVNRDDFGLRSIRSDGQVNVNNAPASQAVSLYVVPAANHGWRHAKIVSDGLYCMALADLVTDGAARVGGFLGESTFAWRNRDGQLRTRSEGVAVFEIVGFRD